MLYSVCLELREHCEVGCPYCLMEHPSPEGSGERWADILDLLLDYGFKRVTFGGGEPLGVPYLYDLGRRARSRGALSLLRTSAALPFDALSLPKAFSIVDVSVDSTDPVVLSACKPGADPAVVLGNISSAARAMPVRGNILITRASIPSLCRTIEDLSEMGVRSVRLQRLVRRGRAVGCFDEYAVSQESYRRAVRDASKCGARVGVEVCEVRSVTRSTLCIVKPDGSVYSGDPSGIVRVGAVEDAATFARLEQELGQSQRDCYAAECERGILPV